jgi:hypothetical protein
MIPEMIKTGDFFVQELLDGFTTAQNGVVRFRHPFACARIDGSGKMEEALARLADPLDSLTGERVYRQPGLAARCWAAEFKGTRIHGVSAAQQREGETEVSIMLSSFPATVSWRDQVMANSGDLLPPHAWELPAGTDLSIPAPGDGEKLDPKFPFQIAADISFHSPILSKPLVGAELVTRVVGHTSAVYGERKYGPKIQNGRRIMSFWQGAVSGYPIEVANEIGLNEKFEVDSMVMSMQPWPAVKLFRDRCIARTRHFLDLSYF